MIFWRCWSLSVRPTRPLAWRSVVPKRFKLNCRFSKLWRYAKFLLKSSRTSRGTWENTWAVLMKELLKKSRVKDLRAFNSVRFAQMLWIPSGFWTEVLSKVMRVRREENYFSKNSMNLLRLGHFEKACPRDFMLSSRIWEHLYWGYDLRKLC